MYIPCNEWTVSVIFVDRYLVSYQPASYSVILDKTVLTFQLLSYCGQGLSTCHVIIVLLASDSFGLWGWTQDVMAATGNCNSGLCIPKVKGNVCPKCLAFVWLVPQNFGVHLYGFLKILRAATRRKIYSPKLVSPIPCNNTHLLPYLTAITSNLCLSCT